MPMRQRSRNGRQPTCTRSPSRRIRGIQPSGDETRIHLGDWHSYTDADEAEADHDQGSTDRTKSGDISSSSPGGSEGDETRDDPSEDETDSDGTNPTAPAPVLVARMARATTRKFERPPTFSGLDEEDVVDWIRRYESIARYNGWNPQDHHDNLEMYLKGSAEKWYNCLV